MKRVILTVICLSLAITTFSCNKQKTKLEAPEQPNGQLVRLGLPKILTDSGFKREERNGNTFIYRDTDSTGSVVTVEVYNTSTQGLEYSCQYVRWMLLSSGIARGANKPNLNETESQCDFTHFEATRMIPMVGKTVVWIDSCYPDNTIVVTGMWEIKYAKMMEAIFDLFVSKISVEKQQAF